MASSALSTGLLNRVTCKVCSKQYDKTTHVPKLLPCQDTICSRCVIKKTEASTAGTQITCPLCRRKYKNPLRGFTTNRAVLDIVEEIQKQTKMKKDNLKCTKHDNKDCVLVCIDCVKGLCAECMKCMHSQHQGHNLEELPKAKPLLQRKFEENAKEQ